MATIFAWSGALRKRGEMDGIKELVNFADQLEGACFDTLNEGICTKDLAGLMEGITPKSVKQRRLHQGNPHPPRKTPCLIASITHKHFILKEEAWSLLFFIFG